MKRKESEENQNVESSVLAVLPILIIGAIIGVIVGGTLGLNETVVGRIVFCVWSAFVGSMFTLFFVYYVSEAIEEIQNYRKERREKSKKRRKRFY